MQPEEALILDLKYKSKPVGKMEPAELNMWAKSAIIKIHVITGWVVPANEFLNVLIGQFEKKMIESYPLVNSDELEYAFRTYGTTVKDWGKQMNLSLIDEALMPYMQARLGVSQIEEQKRLELPEGAKEDTSDEAMELWLQETKKTITRVDLLPVMLYDWLEQKGRINKTPAEKYEYLQEAVMYRQSKLIKALEEQISQENRDALHEFNRMKESGEFTGAEVGILKSLAKKIILFEYLNELK